MNRNLPKHIEKLDMTGLLEYLIQNGMKLEGVPYDKIWVEVDSQEDLKLYSCVFVDMHKSDISL